MTVTTRIIKELEKLESAQPKRLILKCLEGNTEREFTIDELQNHPEAKIVKVIKGTDLNDVDKLIKMIDLKADK